MYAGEQEPPERQAGREDTTGTDRPAPPEKPVVESDTENDSPGPDVLPTQDA